MAWAREITAAIVPAAPGADSPSRLPSAGVPASAASLLFALALAAAPAATTGPPSLDPVAGQPTGRCQWSDAATIADQLETMTAALDATKLPDDLAGQGPFTIFAPTNDAFDAIPDTVFNALLADDFLLESLLRVHVVAGEALTIEDLVAAGSVDTLGGPLTFTATPDGGTLVNGGAANVVCADVVTDNAIVHLIDRVLQPADTGTSSSGSSSPA